MKALTGTVPGDPLSIVSPWTLAALVAGVGAFFALARGLQMARPSPVIALTSVAANCASIVGGVLVFGDPIGEDPLGVVARCVAFAAVIAAAALMPAPAAQPGAGPGRAPTGPRGREHLGSPRRAIRLEPIVSSSVDHGRIAG